ncbi:Hsp20/alpha crystallin family protein [Haloarchaeobius amylolyticus]|uniref:Hsp20/alpha crystallin family protein n=1 Tax=Haloarchaeobius amylolyticus TaxID=1198296 RepID=UPI00226E55F4|nr:Hsp20/alpha crystallin family protein [Haloarchaeobius amylolyticus]
MVLPTTTADTWMQGLELPSKLFGGERDYELYEEGDAFVLGVEMPGFEPDEIDVSWYEHQLTISAEHADEQFGRKRTYHRSFRFPKTVDEDGIEAQYENGVLEVTLPIEGRETQGVTIEVEG